MAKGDGTITEIKDAEGKSFSPKKWRVTVCAGTDPITGKRQRVTKTVRGSKADAKSTRDQIRRDMEGGLRVDADKLTFHEFAGMWLEARKVSGEVGRTRLEREAGMIRLLDGYIAGLTLSELTPQVVENLYTAIKRDKVEKLGSYSGTTLRMLHQMLKQILGKAYDYGFILRNPCDRVKAPKAAEPDRKNLSAEEGSRLLRALRASEEAAYAEMHAKEARQIQRGNLFDRTYLRGLNTVSAILAVRIGLATGMRRGEVFGLTWGCVDFARGVIRVEKSLTAHGELKPPKSKAGVRSIHVDGETMQRLAAWRDEQAAQLRKIRVRQDADSFVCCSEKGGYIDLHNFERWWRQWRKENAFEGLRFHELRHTQATQLLANGVDIKTVQTRMGHSNASITLNWYAHAIPENDERAAQIVGSIFDSKPREARIIEVKSA